MFDVVPTPIPGCVEVRLRRIDDDRGRFVKVFQASRFKALGLPVSQVEQFYSTSREGVIRGLHFQLPPFEHNKLVYCVAGRVLDAVVDLRRGSPTYLHHQTFELDADQPSLIVIPAGLAHGFLARSALATLVYTVSSEHQPAHDLGIRWDSAGVAWPVSSPVVSVRDAALTPLAAFESPFTFTPVPVAPEGRA